MNRLFPCALAAASLFAQTPATVSSALQFEVASLKPSAPGGTTGGIRPSAGGERYIGSNISPKLMATVAWRLRDDQIGGGPAWFGDDRYDMAAKAEHPSNIEDLHAMLRNMMVERFRLKFHWEKKKMAVYALTVDSGGAKMRAHEAQSAGDPWIDNKVEQLKTTLHATSVSMEFLAWRLSLMLDRPVVDMTGLKGGFDFDLSFTKQLPPSVSDGAAPMLNGMPLDTNGPTVFEATRRQLGLRLEKQEGMVDFLVIDHAERPQEN